MALVKRGTKGSPISASEYDAVIDQVETNQESVEVIQGQFVDSEVTLSFADLAAATAYWNLMDAASLTPSNNVEIYLQDVNQFWKWDSGETAKAVLSRANIEPKNTFNATDEVNPSTMKATADFLASETEAIPTSGSTNAVQSGGVANALKNKANLEIVSNNLFNKETISSGVFTDSNNNGDLLENLNLFTSDFIEVESGKTYHFPLISFASYWDDDFVFVSGAPRNTPTTSLTIPVGVKYLKLSENLADLNTFYINKDIDLGFDEFKQEVKTDELKRVYDKIKSEKINPIKENDWYDPNFINPYTQRSISQGLSNITQDFAWLKISDVFHQKSIILNKENVLEFTATSTSLRNESPAFSKLFLESLGYEVNDFIKIGVWIKFPDATSINTRRLYFSSSSSLPSAKVVDTNDWVWYESDDLRQFASDDWMQFWLGGRDLVAGEKYYIKGLTITNITKDTWVGERKSTKFEKGLLKPYVNLYPYSQFIFEDNQILKDAYQQDQSNLVREITTLTGEPIKGNGFKFTGNVDTRNRLNVPFVVGGNHSIWGIDKALLPQIKKDVWLQLSFYVKMTSTLNDFKVNFLNERSYGMYNDLRDLEEGTWHYVKSIPILLSADSIKDFQSYIVQIDSVIAPSDGSQVAFEVAGLNYSVNEDKFAFRHDYINNRASSNRFYGQKMTTFTDSIGAANQWQVWANGFLGTNHVNRCIGGTTVSNSSQTAWVTMDGEYIDRPADEAHRPSGTEGVDYQAIESSMNRQERIDTIPLDTKLLILGGGINDTPGVPIGNISDAPSDANGASYIASVKSMFLKAEARVPDAVKVRMLLNPRQGENETPIYDDGNGTTHYLYEYRDVDRILADIFGFHTIDVNNIGVNTTNWADFSNDTIHPTPEMDRLTAGLFVNGINQIQMFDVVKGI